MCYSTVFAAVIENIEWSSATFICFLYYCGSCEPGHVSVFVYIGRQQKLSRILKLMLACIHFFTNGFSSHMEPAVIKRLTFLLPALGYILLSTNFPGSILIIDIFVSWKHAISSSSNLHVSDIMFLNDLLYFKEIYFCKMLKYTLPFSHG